MLESIFQANSRHNIINVAFPLYLIFDRDDSLVQNGCIHLLREANAKSRSLQKYKENMAQGKRFLTRNLTDMYALTLTLDILDSR